jgi:hypothetical protein
MAIIGGFLSEEILITRWAGRGTVGCHFRGWESPPLVFLYVQWLLDVVYGRRLGRRLGRLGRRRRHLLHPELSLQISRPTAA